MAIENFEQILQSINNSEIRIALEKLFAMAGIGTGSDGTSLSQDVIGDVTGDLTGNADTATVTAKLLPGTAPVNAVKAGGILTWDTFATIGDTILIGSRLYTFVADGTKSADGEIDIGASTAAHSQAEILAAIDGSDTNSAINTDVVMSAFDVNDTCIVTAIVAGVVGNDIATVTTVNDATNKFTAATQLLGVDGTVGDAGTTIVANGNTYTAKAANTTADANWKKLPQTPFLGTGAGPQTITSVVDLGETDFDTDVIILDGSLACTVTDWTPTPGVTYVLNCIESTTDPVVNLTAGITVDEAGNDILTFDTAEDTIVLKMISASRMVIMSNDGVTMSGA
jgi:hypothetical protein